MDRASLLQLLSVSGSMKTYELDQGAPGSQVYRDLAWLRGQGLVSSQRVVDEDRILFFCVDHGEVLTSENYDAHSDCQCPPFHPTVLEWSITPGRSG